MEVTGADLRAFEGTLIAWRLQFGKSIQETLRKQARLICVNLAYNTQPYGLDDAALKVGQRATARDISRVYLSMTRIFNVIQARSESAAKGFIKSVKTGNLTHAREIMTAFGLGEFSSVPIGPFDASIHNDLRLKNRRGRIPKNLKPRLIVTDPRALTAYQKKMAKRVGYGKSGWATCADQLGGSRGIPLWAKRHRAPATVQDFSGSGDNPRIVMTSQVKYIDTILPENMRTDALEKQRTKMQKEIRLALARSARNARLAA